MKIRWPYRILLTITVLNFAIISEAKTLNSKSGHVQYLANAGVMVTLDETKILFDPAFHEHFGHYELVPPNVEAALLAGEAPYDEVDAVFISHHHGDHFSAPAVLDLLKAQQQIQLFAPRQAVTALEQLLDEDDALGQRLHAVDLAHLDAPVSLKGPGFVAEAVRIPHSGWPTQRTEVENIAWRVTLNDRLTVVHLGDADPNDDHFSPDAGWWSQRKPALALPPYWFFTARDGALILEQRIHAERNIGVHVPTAVPDDPNKRPVGYRQVELFTQPGESRLIPLPAPEEDSR